MAPDYFANARHDVLAMIPRRPRTRILEVGGGDFPTLRQAAAESGAEAWGVDVRDTATPLDRFLRGSINDPAIRAQLPDGGFDLIIANDVIEHIEDTEAFLETLHDAVAGDGLIAMSVPNARQVRFAFHVLIRGTFPREDAGLFDRTHLRWFCRKDVERLATMAGLQVVDRRSVGRVVPRFMARSSLAEFGALQNIFLFKKL